MDSGIEGVHVIPIFIFHPGLQWARLAPAVFHKKLPKGQRVQPEASPLLPECNNG